MRLPQEKFERSLKVSIYVEHRESVACEDELYRFQLKKRIFIGEHINNYTKLLTDLANVDEIIKDEDNVLILLSSLLDEKYETFILTLINGNASLSYNNVSAALVNLEVRRKDKESSSSSTTIETLTARVIGSNYQKGKRDVGESKLVIANWERICVLSARKKDIGILIV